MTDLEFQCRHPKFSRTNPPASSAYARHEIAKERYLAAKRQRLEREAAFDGFRRAIAAARGLLNGATRSAGTHLEDKKSASLPAE